MNIDAQINSTLEHMLIWHGVCCWMFPELMAELESKRNG